MVIAGPWRTYLFDLDQAAQHDTPQSPAVVQLTGIYRNLLRQEVEV